MTRKENVYFWGGVTLLTALMLGLMAMSVRGADSPRLTPPAAVQLYAAPQLEQCIAATCRVEVPGGARGTGCFYGWQVRGTVRRGLVITAAHVIRGTARGAIIVLRFGRRLVQVPCRVAWQDDRVDGAVLEFAESDWPQGEPALVPVPIGNFDVPEGQSLYSVGFPAGARQPWILRTRARGHTQAGMLRFHPGPELGRSGSAVFAHDAAGKPVIVGVVAQRDSGGMHADTVGMAVTPRMIWRQERLDARQPGRETADMLMSAGVETQCPPGQLCPAPQYGAQTVPQSADPYRILPYRQQSDQRIGRIESEVQRLPEQSPGSLPLPPLMPPLDLGPLEARVRTLENAVNAQAVRLGELGETERIAKELAATVAKRDADFAKDLAAAKGETAALANAVAEDLDDENPKGPLGRLKARLEERVEGVKEKVGGVFGLPTFLGGTGLGLGGIAVVIALVALFTRRQLRERRETGDPTPGERVLRGAETVAAAIPGERLDTVLRNMREFYERALDRVAPRPPAPPAA